MSSTEEEVPLDNIPKKRKKGLKQVVYKCELIKKARVKGDEYRNYKGNVVNARIPGKPCG